MRNRFIQTFALAAALFLPFAQAAHAHGNEAQLLGHHWEVPAYIGEVHFQVVLMLIAAAALFVGSLAVHKWSERRIKR